MPKRKKRSVERQIEGKKEEENANIKDFNALVSIFLIFATIKYLISE